MTGKGFAHGKIILIGEHAAVYGHPVIALPFFPTKVTIEVLYSKENKCESIADSEALIALFLQLQTHLKTGPVEVKLESSIPIGAGLGSSAALASALTEAMYALANQALSDDTRFEWTQFSESIAHGNPSGVDALATTHPYAIYYVKGHIPLPIKMSLSGFLVVGHTKVKGNTKKAVNDVATLINASQGHSEIKSIVAATAVAKKALDANDIHALGRAMNQAHGALVNLTLSHPKIERLIVIANENDALGAKLTGGGRGGCVIALAASQATAERIKSAWSLETDAVWIMTLEG